MADLTARYPTSPSFQAVNFRVVTPTITSETNTGKVRRVGYGHSYYTFEARYPSLTPVQRGQVMGYLGFARGPALSFEVVLPDISVSKASLARIRTTSNNLPRTSGTGTVGATSISVTNVSDTLNVPMIAAGDFFKFFNHSKVYMAAADMFTASGTTTLFFSGALVANVPNNTPITISNVPFTCILDEEVQEFESGIGGITTLSVAMREVW
jgi:hypothetical protein